MKVTVQSSNLSSLSPKLMVYTSALGLVGQSSAPNSMGATVSVSTSVTAGQGYYIKVLAAGGFGAIGGYGLLVNMGSQSQSPIPPPNTVVAQQPDQGGGSTNNAALVSGPVDTTSDPGSGSPAPVYTTIGTLREWAEVFTATPATLPPPVAQPVSPPISTTIETPIVLIVTAPSIAPSPVKLGTAVTTKHHATAVVTHRSVPRFPVEHRIKRVFDQAKPRDHHSG